MITDTARRDELLSEWRGLCQKQRQLEFTVASVIDGAFLLEPCRICYSLFLVCAYAILDDVLEAMRDEGVFSCAGKTLNARMEASKKAIAWLDYALIDQGRTERNRVAHDFATLKIAPSCKYIRAIEEQLIAWNIISDEPTMWRHLVNATWG